MRSFWSNAPMLRIALALMAGIGLAIAGGEQKGLPWLIMGLFILSTIAAGLYGQLKTTTLSYRFRIYNGVALILLVVCIGYLLTWLHIQKNYDNHFSKFCQDGNILVAEIDEPPVVRERIMMAVGEVKEVDAAGERIKTSGKIQFSFVKDSLSETLDYGDVVLFKSRIDSVAGPKNPGEFSYRRYLAFQQIYHDAYLQQGDWKLIDQARGNSFLSFVYKVRDSFLQLIEKYVKDKNDFGVASAIMLGYRDYINGDIMRAYASSGTIHVLSVSGLHVGIMFVMLNFLLKWMDERGKKLEIVKAAIIILFIWFYAVLTGMSPPVLRSAMMFSLIQTGRVLSRNVNTYNVVAGSAVFLMLLDPFVLADVGFELSYLAVFGIVYLFPKISPLVVIKIPQSPEYKKQSNIFYKAVMLVRYDLKWLFLKVCDGTWQLIAVSIAAQIATMPLSVLYFYQFPNFFLISNLVVIPLSNLVLFTGTALFAFGHIPYLNAATGWLFNWLLRVLDAFIFGIDRVPFAQMKGLSINAAEMITMYALIVLACWLTEEKRAKVLMASLFLLVGLCSFNSYKSVRNSYLKEIVVYSTPKQKAIAFISGKKAWYDFDSALWNNVNTMNFRIRHHWANCGLESETPLDNTTGNFRQFDFGKLVLFEGKKILIVDSSPHRTEFNGVEKLKTDLVIISGNPQCSLGELQKMVDFQEVVFDSSNKPGKIKSWKMDCIKSKINFWDVNAQGAYIKRLDD